jgi:glutaconate CoA-transferase, subunit A
VAAGCVNQVEVAYAFGHEIRGLSPASRRMVESGRCKVTAEISNAGYQWRFLAASMGVPFVPARTMLGTDTFEKSSAKVVKDPWSGKPICLLPACYPDVVVLHVHRCDIYGNAQIDGILVEDYELARAARRLIVTSEEIVSPDFIRSQPRQTVVPYFLVDAVCEVPYGAHPCHMPYAYYFDEQHIHEWLTVSRTEEGAQSYFDKYVFGVKDFDEYLERVGGMRKLKYLKRVEQLRESAWTAEEA